MLEGAQRAATHARPEGREALAREMLAGFERELGENPQGHRAGRLHYESARLLEWPLADLPKAAEHYQKAHAHLPNHLPSVQGARRTLTALKKHPLAITLFDLEIRLTSDPQRKAVLYYEKGLMHEEAQGQKREAREAFEAGLELDPGNTSLQKAVERAEIGAKAWDKLDRTYERAANSASQDPRLRAALIAGRARVLESRRGDVRGATELYRVALDTDPRVATAVHALKRLCLAERRYSDLATVLKREAELVQDRSARALSLYAAGRVLGDRLGSLDAAIEAFEAAAREAPDDRVVLEELARAYELGKRFADLVRVLEKLAMLSESPGEKVGYLHRIGQIAEERLENVELAAAWHERARAVDPSYLPSLQALAKLYERKGDYAALLAVHAGEAEGALDAARRAAAHARMAEIYERRLNDVELATQHHSRALGIVPGYGPSFKALSRLLAQGARFAELVELYERAVELGGDNETKITYLFKIGRLHEDALSQPGQAYLAYRRVLEIDAHHLGAIHAMQRAAERAERFQDLIAALELEVPRVPDKRRKLELLCRAGEVAEIELDDEALALSFYKKAFEIEATYAPALSGLGRVHYKAGRWEDLLETYRSELGSGVRGAAAAALLCKMGEIYEERVGREDAALDAYRRAVQADPRHRPSLAALERKLLALGHHEELIKLLEVEVGSAKTADERARAALRIAEVNEYRLDKADRALVAYEAALNAVPDFGPARDGRVRLLSQAKDWKRLVEELERQAKSAPDPALSVAASLVLGAVYRDELGDPARATTAFEAVLERDPGNVEAMLALEPLYGERADWNALANLFATEARVLADPGARVAALRELGRVEEKRGGDDLARARDAELMVLQLAPADPTALGALERLSFRLGDPALVAQVATQLMGASDRSVSAEHTTRLAEMLELGGDGSALELYRKALERESDNLAAAHGLARLADRSSDPRLLEEAATLCVEVLRDPRLAAQLLTRAAELSAGAGDRTGAAVSLERALEVCPDHDLAARHLAALLSSGGDVERLIRQLSQAAQASTNKERVVDLWVLVAGLQADQRGDLPGALSSLHRAEALMAKHPGLLMKLAELYERDAQWAKAVERLQQLATLPNVEQGVRLDAHARLGAILDERLSDPDRARASIEAVLAVNPKHVGALERLVKLELRRGRKDAAADAATQLVSMASDPAQRLNALCELGRVEKARGNYGVAGTAFQQAVRHTGLAGDAAEELRDLIERGPRRTDSPTWESYVAALTHYVEHARGTGAPLAPVFLEIARVYGGPLQQNERAISALRSGLEVSDEVALHSELAQRLYAAGNPGDALRSLRRVLEENVADAGAWRKLGDCFRALGKNADASLTLGPLAALGQANDLELSTLAQRQPRVGVAPPRSFDQTEVEATALVEPRDPGRRLLVQLSDLLEKIYPPDLDSRGLSNRDRLGVRGNSPLRGLADRIGAIFGVTDFDLYLSPSPAVALEVQFTDPVSIIVPPFVPQLPESAQAFLFGRIMVDIAQKLYAVDGLSPDAIAQLLGGAARMAEPSFTTPTANEEALATFAKRVSRALPWIGRGPIEDAARDYAAASIADFDEWVARIRIGAARAASIVADDLPAAVTVLRQTEGDLSGAQGAALTRANRMINDMMIFWVSDQALAIRRRLGLY